MAGNRRERDEFAARALMRGKSKRRPEEAKAMMWDIYEFRLANETPWEELAKKHGISPVYCMNLAAKAKKIMAEARKFDPQAQDLEKEMLHFAPLAAQALTENLVNADPKVTVAYWQGVGGLVPRQEVTQVTEEEMKGQEKRTLSAMNPKLRAVVDADYTIEDTEEEGAGTIPQQDTGPDPKSGD